ncbi:MAG: amino acid racemase [Acidobacteriota bacterium]|nr:amino acid racemase [Acidobacteriota bacterium]
MAALTLGIIGGIAPESTIEYYRTIVVHHRERTGGHYPSIIINSIDLEKMLTLVAERQFPELVSYLLEEIARLAAAGAKIGLLASNTPHIVFDDLRSRSPIPLISIVEATFRAAEKAGLRRLALFGTRFTMQADFYRSFFEPRGIAMIAPNAADQDFIHTKYMDELVNAKFLDSTRNAMLAIAERMQRDSRIDGLILGGTELPLLLRETSWRDIRLLDTGRLHAESAVEHLLA